MIPARTGSRTDSAICTIFPHAGYGDALPFRDGNIVIIRFFLESIGEFFDIVEFPVHPGKFFPVHHIVRKLFGYVIAIGFDLVFHIERNGRHSLEDEFVLIGTIGRKLGGIRSPLGIRSAVQVLSKGVLFRGSTIYLPSALGIDGLRAGSLIHKFALFSLSINYYSIVGRAGCFQHTAIGIFPIVVHPITQSDGAFGAGGSQLDFTAFSVCPGGGVSSGIRRSIDFDPINGQIAGGLDCYVVQIILKGSVCISRSFYIGTAGMDFAAYGYLTTIDIYTMIGINSTIIVFCCSIFGVAGSHRTRASINLNRI